jgi:hypothetical protein
MWKGHSGSVSAQAGSEKRTTEPSGRRSRDEIQTGGCEARLEKRDAGVVREVRAETEGS